MRKNRVGRKISILYVQFFVYNQKCYKNHLFSEFSIGVKERSELSLKFFINLKLFPVAPSYPTSLCPLTHL